MGGGIFVALLPPHTQVLQVSDGLGPQGPEARAGAEEEGRLVGGQGRFPPTDARVGARLLKFSSAWTEAPRFARMVVSKGIPLIWAEGAPRLGFPRLSSGPRSPILDPLIRRFLEQGVVRRVPYQKCFVSHVFAVPKSAGEFRLVLNLSRLNTFTRVPSFKMPNHNSLRALIPPMAWMAKLDLRDAYLHVPVQEKFQKFLSFVFRGEVFQFLALPFGLSSAPFIFTRLVQFPVEILRKQGVNVIAYLDDLIMWGNSELEVRRAVRLAQATFTRLGFLLNRKKSVLRPTQVLTWLGLVWNTRTFSIALPLSFQEKVRKGAVEVLASSRTSRRSLERLQGLMAFAAQVLPFARLNAHRLPGFLRECQGRTRDHPVPTSLSLKKVVRWWSVDLNLKAAVRIRDAPPSVQVFSDASSVGWGALNQAGDSIHGVWSGPLTELHINGKELLAVAYALESSLVQDGGSVALFLDNLAAFFALKNKGSKSSSVMQDIMQRILLVLEERRLSIVPSYLKGNANVAADLLSRDAAVPTEWTLTGPTFWGLVRAMGWVPEVDLMATPLNAKLHCFVSPFPVKGAAGTDFFAVDLSRWERIYVFPPQKLILRTLVHLRNFRGRVLLIAPCLPSQPWYPFLMQKARRCFRLRERPYQVVQGKRVMATSRIFSHLRGWEF